MPLLQYLDEIANAYLSPIHEIQEAQPRFVAKRLKEPLLKALSAAGSAGIKVKDLAAQLKVKPGNIFSWFYTTGKKISGIKKIGEAKYSYAG